VNHPKGNPAAPRDYQDRIGVIRNVSPRPGEGLFADFYFNPKHALAEQLIWDAEHAPENVGFSHNVEARTLRRGEQIVVEAITRVQSVDLVADPATTRSLFESAKNGDDISSAEKARTITVYDLKREYPELVEELCREMVEEQRRLQAEVDRLAASEAAHQKGELARRLLRRFKLPDPDSDDPKDRLIVSEQFMDLLLAAEDEKAMQELIEERVRLARSSGFFQIVTKPCSRDQNLARSPTETDVRSFVEAIT
jgi:hypothetical protein